MHSRGVQFFPFWKGGVGRWGKGSFPFFTMCSHHVLIRLLLSSQRIPQVPKLFPKMFPIAPLFDLLWFAQSSTSMYINWKGGDHREKHVLFLFCNLGSTKVLLLWSDQKFQKKLVMGKSIWPLPKKKEKGKKRKKEKKKCEHTHELINTN